MKLLFAYDTTTGEWIPDKSMLIEQNEEGIYEIPKGFTDVEPLQPCYKPVFNKEKNTWVETITEEELERINTPPDVSLSDTEILGQQMTERELEAMVQGQQITDLEIATMFQGQFMTDYELRLLALEDKANVIV